MTTVFSDALTGGDTGRQSENERMVFPASVLGAATGNQIRVSFLFHGTDGGGPYVFGPCYIGQSGTAPNFTGDQVQVLFSGAGTFNIPVPNPSTVASDFVTLAQAWDNTKSYTVSWLVGSIPGSAAMPFHFTTGPDLWGSGSGSTTTSTANQTAPAGLTVQFSGLDFLVTLIEVQAGGGGGGMPPVGASM